MSQAELKKWKQKALHLASVLKKKESTLRQYQQSLKKSTKLLTGISKKISSELKTAHRIHHLLLPTRLPTIKGFNFSFKFRPAGKQPGEGKDFYSLTPSLPEKTFALSLFSCPSYSLSALLLSAQLKIPPTRQQGPQSYVSSLLKEFQKSQSLSVSSTESPGGRKKNIDLFYAVVAQNSLQVSFCLTGGMGVFLWQAHTKKLKKLPPSPFLSPKVRTLPLSYKDRLIVLSPGLLALPHLKTQLLKENLQNTPVHELRNHIMYNSQKATSSRDQSLLIMEVAKKQPLRITKTL